MNLLKSNQNNVIMILEAHLINGYYGDSSEVSEMYRSWYFDSVWVKRINLLIASSLQFPVILQENGFFRLGLTESLNRNRKRRNITAPSTIFDIYCVEQNSLIYHC